MHSSYLRFLPPDLVPDTDIRPESTWWPWRGHDIHVERVPNPDAPMRALLIHGGGGHAGALWPFAAAAAAHGVEVLTPDLPGYGRTRVPSERHVRYGDWVDCVSALITAEKAADPRPLVVVGASMGGMLAYEGAARTGLVDAVVATCLLDTRRPEVRAAVARHPWLGRYGSRLLVSGLDDIVVPIRWFANMAAISNDPALTALIERDRLGGGARTPLGFVRTYLGWAPAVEPEDFTSCPVWLTHPAADRWTPVSLSRAFFDRIAAPKRLIMLDNAGHYPIEQPGIGQLVRALTELRDRFVSDAV